MSSFLVLGDTAVHRILINLSRTEILDFQSKIQDSLRQFSVGSERAFQPEPGVIKRPTGQKTLFRPFTSAHSVGTKIIVDPAPTKDATGALQKSPLNGILALCDERGNPSGVINAQAVTGFRTSLSALIPYTFRKRTDRILVFGAGTQALWHIRLALALRGAEIKTVTLVNRSVGRAQAVVEQLKGENLEYWKSAAELKYLDPSESTYDRAVRDELFNADVIFCTVPSYKPLFRAQEIIGGDLRRRPLITAIGSWQADMIEVDPALIRHIVDDRAAFNPHDTTGGIVLVDDREATMQNSGEIIQSSLQSKEIVEIGEILEMRNGGSKRQDRLEAWLQEGLVCFKSIGVSLTDLITGNAILEKARERGIGYSIPEF